MFEFKRANETSPLLFVCKGGRAIVTVTHDKKVILLDDLALDDARYALEQLALMAAGVD